MLKTEHDSPDMAERIAVAWDVSPVAVGHEEEPQVDYEHGQHWITCRPCGAQWSVVDAEGGPAIDGFDFEEVSDGDGSCLEESDE